MREPEPPGSSAHESEERGGLVVLEQSDVVGQSEPACGSMPTEPASPRVVALEVAGEREDCADLGIGELLGVLRSERSAGQRLEGEAAGLYVVGDERRRRDRRFPGGQQPVDTQLVAEPAAG